MNCFVRHVACLMAGMLMLWSSQDLSAQQSSSEDVEAIHAVVQSQLQAFATDDAAAAFGLATASTQSLVGSPENLMRLVSHLYPPIYRHRQVIFEGLEIFEGEAMQIISLTDSENAVWIAVYLMQQEPDGSWKVDGYGLFQTDSMAI